MEMLSENDRVEVKKILDGELSGEVRVTLYTRRSGIDAPGFPVCRSCPETEQLLTEVAALHEKIRLTVIDVSEDAEAARTEGIEGSYPVLVFQGASVKGRLRYLGLPAGYEFRTLLDALIAVSRGESGLSPASRDELAKVTSPTLIQVYVTPG